MAGCRFGTTPWPTEPSRQGEIVGPIWEHRSLVPPSELPSGTEVPIRSVRHELGVVMTPDCDLIWDFESRFADDAARAAFTPENPEAEKKAAAVPHVLLCEVYDEADIFDHVRESRLRRAGQGNRDRPGTAARPARGTGRGCRKYNLDFREPLPCAASLYICRRMPFSGEVNQNSLRSARVYLHNLIHRFSLLSRVGVPAD